MQEEKLFVWGMFPWLSGRDRWCWMRPGLAGTNLCFVRLRYMGSTVLVDISDVEGREAATLYASSV